MPQLSLCSWRGYPYPPSNPWRSMMMTKRSVIQGWGRPRRPRKDSVHLPLSELPHGRTLGNVQVFSEVNYRDEPLDWGTPSAQDYDLSSDDSIGDKLVAMAGISHLPLTPAPSNRSSKGKGKQRERAPFNTDDLDNNLDSHAYDHGYNRSVSTNFTVYALTKDKKSQLPSSLLCKNNSTCFGCLWCLWLSLSCFGSIWLNLKIWKNAEKS